MTVSGRPGQQQQHKYHVMSYNEEVVLIHGKAKDASCRIKKFGATVVSWKVDGIENIFVSKKAILDGTKAIRGGIPVCFPSFGPWQFGPAHGFARNSKEWVVEKGPMVDEKTSDVTVVLTLADSEETRNMWDHKFKFTYTITLTPR